MDNNEVKEDYLLSDISNNSYNNDDNKEVAIYKCTCQNCNTSFYCFSNDDICFYCGEKCDISNEYNNMENMFYLPFDKSIDDAKTIYKKYIRFKVLIPIIFRRKSTINNLKKVYIPSVIKDCNINGSIIFYAADKANKDTLTKYEVCHNINVDFDNVLLSLSSKFDNEKIFVMNNYNFDNLKEFSRDDINDSFCIIADIDNNSSNERINLFLNKYVIGLVRDDIRHNLKKVKDNATKIEVKSEKTVLLPAYVLNVKDNICFINAQNGEIFVNYNIEKKYICIFSILCFALIFVLVFLLAWII